MSVVVQTHAAATLYRQCKHFVLRLLLCVVSLAATAHAAEQELDAGSEMEKGGSDKQS